MNIYTENIRVVSLMAGLEIEGSIKKGGSYIMGNTAVTTVLFLAQVLHNTGV